MTREHILCAALIYCMWGLGIYSCIRMLAAVVNQIWSKDVEVE